MLVSLLAHNPDILIIINDISAIFSVEISLEPPSLCGFWCATSFCQKWRESSRVEGIVNSGGNRPKWRESSKVKAIVKSGGDRVSYTSQLRTLVTRVLEPGTRK